MYASNCTASRPIIRHVSSSSGVDRPDGGHVTCMRKRPGASRVNVRRSLAIIWIITAFLVMLWCWMSFSGPYRWFAEWQMQHFGSYELELTLFGPRNRPADPGRVSGRLGAAGGIAGHHSRRFGWRMPGATHTIALLGLAALAVGAAGGGLGYLKLQTPLTHADLVLNAGTEVLPAADTVAVTAIALPRPDRQLRGNRRWRHQPLDIRAAGRSGVAARRSHPILAEDQPDRVEPAGWHRWLADAPYAAEREPTPVSV